MVPRNVVHNDFKCNSRVLYTFVPNKSFGQLLDNSPKDFIFSKTFNSEFSYIEAWLTDLNSKPREMEDKININLVINESAKQKMTRYSVQSRDGIFAQGF